MSVQTTAERLASLDAELTLARVVLAWYADPGHWVGEWPWGKPAAWTDAGMRARAALAAMEEGAGNGN